MIQNSYDNLENRLCRKRCTRIHMKRLTDNRSRDVSPEPLLMKLKKTRQHKKRFQAAEVKRDNLDLYDKILKICKSKIPKEKNAAKSLSYKLRKRKDDILRDNLNLYDKILQISQRKILKNKTYIAKSLNYRLRNKKGEIIRENQNLYDRILQISERKILKKKNNASKSLNYSIRKREADRIIKDNKELFNRLNEKKSEYKDHISKRNLHKRFKKIIENQRNRSKLSNGFNVTEARISNINREKFSTEISSKDLEIGKSSNNNTLLTPTLRTHEHPNC